MSIPNVVYSPLFLFLALGLLIGIEGCDASTPNTKMQSSSDVSKSPVPEATVGSVVPDDASKRSIELIDINAASLETFLETKRGKIVVLDYWATWCPPCVQEFPGLVQLSKEYSTTELCCISLCCDHQGLEPLAEAKASALEFLKGQQATIENLFATEEADTFFRERKMTSIPVVEIYGTDGKLHQRFDGESGEFSYDKVRQVVQELVKRSRTQ